MIRLVRKAANSTARAPGQPGAVSAATVDCVV